MKAIYRISFILFLIVFIQADAFAISKVAKRYNVLKFYGGISKAEGTYSGIPGDRNADDVINDNLIDIDSDEIYDDGFHLGVSYGSLRNNRNLIQLGIRYINYNLNDVIRLDPSSELSFANNTNLYQFDLDFDLDYYFFDVMKTPFNPFVGVGASGGIAVFSVKGFESEEDINFNLRLNAGFDLMVWKAPDNQTALSLSSNNSWNFLVSNDRPRQFNIGGALKYWFRY